MRFPKRYPKTFRALIAVVSVLVVLVIIGIIVGPQEDSAHKPSGKFASLIVAYTEQKAVWDAEKEGIGGGGSADYFDYGPLPPGQVLVVDPEKQTVLAGVQSGLAESLRATTPANVTLVVWVHRYTATVGWYQNCDKARGVQYRAIMTFISTRSYGVPAADVHDGEELGSAMVRGSDPPAKTSSCVDHYGSHVSDGAMAAAIEDWIRGTNATAPPGATPSMVTSAPADTPTSASSSSSSSSSSSTSAAETGTVSATLGEAVELDGIVATTRVRATLVKWVDSTEALDEYEQPAAGHRYVAAQLTLQNVGSVPYSENPGTGAIVIDSLGKEYSQAFPSKISAGSLFADPTTLSQGQSASGYVVFEVPDAAKIAKVRFAPDAGYGQAGIWSLP